MFPISIDEVASCVKGLKRIDSKFKHLQLCGRHQSDMLPHGVLKVIPNEMVHQDTACIHNYDRGGGSGSNPWTTYAKSTDGDYPEVKVEP